MLGQVRVVLLATNLHIFLVKNLLLFSFLFQNLNCPICGQASEEKDGEKEKEDVQEVPHFPAHFSDESLCSTI